MADTETRDETRRAIPRGHPVSWWMLGITTFAILITSIDRAILPTLLPDISQEFGLNATQSGLLVSLSFLGTFIGAILFGVLGDVIGRGHRRAWTWMLAVVITCAASIATAFTRSVSGLAVWRVSVRTEEVGRYESPWKALRNATRERNVWWGTLAASSGMGLIIGIAFGLSGVVGPAVSGYLIDTTGFTINYLVMAGFCLLVLIPTYLLRETVRHGREPAVSAS